MKVCEMDRRQENEAKKENGPLRLVEEGLELVYEGSNVDAFGFGGQDGLLHGEQRGRERTDSERAQLLARLQTFPCSDHFHAQSGQFKVGL